MTALVKVTLWIVVFLLFLHSGWYRLLPYCSSCRIVTVFVTGRSERCTLRQALAAYRQERLRFGGRSKNRRMLREERDGIQLWEVDSWRVWTPRSAAPWLGVSTSTRYRAMDVSGEVLVRPGDVVLDCGGYIGDSAMEALALGARLVVSIEPSPRNLICLRRNLEKEIGQGRVIVAEKGVWDREDVLVLEENPHDAAQDQIRGVRHSSGQDGGKTVSLTTIDKLVEELRLERVDFIKMDIEGAEQRAILGAKNTIAKFRPRMAIAAYHLPSDRERIPELVKSAWPGYRVEWGRCLLAPDGHIRPQMFYFH